ncbi:protein ROS1-like [Abrus precatorius]|uniref:Protein ROS1-like n=2 Tax=rosids TaxID=71275 RepID=A0A8B8M5G6_ABRPR|nr:protein ROS1-like [Abrus precatorius]
MEVGEMDRKEPQLEVPWIPTTPVKPGPPKPVPICTTGEGMGHHANGAVACAEFSLGEEKNCRSRDGSVANIAGDNGKTYKQTASDAVSIYGNPGFTEHLFTVVAESANSNVIQQEGNDGLKNPFIPSIITRDNSRDSQEISYIAWCSKRTSQDTSFTVDTNKVETRQIASMQITVEEKDPGGEEKNVPAKKFDNNVPPINKELCDPLTEFTSVSSPFKDNDNLDKGSSHDTDLNKTPQQKSRRRKHRPKVIKEDKPKRTRKPATPKAVQSKDNLTGKRRYVRRKGLNKTAASPAEVTGELAKEMPGSANISCRRSLNFDMGTKDGSSVDIENATLLGKENGVVVQQTDVGLANDLNSYMKQASNSHMSLPEDTQAPSTPSRKRSGTKTTENSTGKRKYVRRKGLNKTSTPPTEVTGVLTKEMPGSEKISCISLSFDIGTKDQSSADRENETALLGKENVVIQETDVGIANNLSIANNLNSSMKLASNCHMSLPEDTQAPNTSTSRKSSGTKTMENSTGKRKYVRTKQLNKTSPTGVTGELTKEMPGSVKMSFVSSLNFDIETKYQSSADLENATVLLSKENGAVIKETVGLAYDLNSSMKQASNSHMSLPEDTQSPNTSSRKRSGTKTQENSTGKRKYVRRKVVNKTSPTEVTGEQTKEKMPESAQMSSIGSVNFDERARDQSSAVKECVTVHSGNEIGEVMWEMKQVPYDTQFPSTSSKINLPGAKTENPTGKRKNVRKRGLTNAAPIPPTEMKDLTEAMMLESNNMSWRRSLNFGMGTIEKSYAGRENLVLHIGKENNIVLEETKVGLAYNRDTRMKQALNNYMPLPEEMHDPSKSISTINPLGAKLNANSAENKHKRKGQLTTQNGNISNSQVSTIRLQMDGSKRQHSGTIKCADDSDMNLIGAHYNGLPTYQTNFWVQFPNLQKKRRTEKGKTSNTYVTSSVTTTEVQPTHPHEDAQVHPCASSSNCWIYSSGYNTEQVPAMCESTENVIDNSQTFEEFLLSLRRLTERSQSPTQIYDFGSLTRIGNCDAEPSYTAKQLGLSAQQKCIDALVPETRTSLTKKKRSRKKGALSSSAYSSTNEMQQHHNFTGGNNHLPVPMGQSMGISTEYILHEVLWKTINNVDALTEQFRQLTIYAEARDLVLYEQNAVVPYNQQNQNSLIHGDGAIVPFQGPFEPIKKQHPRPKVDLDDETDRVWKLLMLDINSHGIDGTDEDKAKWWEEERKVFRGRADSFIARMHLVQGDRRFSRWKGSVVDSVVGVFLTQNVSDHLSSSAYMSLAARFPKQSSSTSETYHAEDMKLVVNKPQVHIVEPEENTEWDVKLLNQSVYDQSSMTVDIVEHSGEKAVNSNDSCRTVSSVISLTDESNSRLSESSQRNIKENCSPTRRELLSATIEEEEKSGYNGDGKELNDIVSSQCFVVSSQIYGDFSNDQNPEKIGSCSDSNSEIEDLSSSAKYNHFDSSTSFCKLLEMVSSTRFYDDNSQKSRNESLRDTYDQSICMQHDNPTESLKKPNVTPGPSEASIITSHGCTFKLTPSSGVLEDNGFDPFKTEPSSSSILKNKDENDMNRPSFQTAEPAGQVAVIHSQSIVSQVHPQEQSKHAQQSFFNNAGQAQELLQKERGLDLGDHKNDARNETNEISSAPLKLKSRGQGKEKKDDFKWDSLRIKAQAKAGKREKTENTMDSLDWDAVRCADVNEIANTIKERGMNNRLAERIKNFLNRLVEEHGSIDLEWLRDVPPDKAKEYLLSIKGLGLKSVECVRLLTLHHLAFPVDTNVGRIAVRLGWVPLQPLPESLQLHLLELYPVLESIQKYLWPRLCKLDQRTLYELHYQMITFGKVFCTKSKPNCNACPMRGECRHFASAFASARLALPGPEQKSIVSTARNSVTDHNPSEIISSLHLPPPENTSQAEEIQLTEVSRQLESKSEINICHPIIEEPTTPEPECSQISETDIEDAFYEDSCEIPTIKLNIEEFTLNLQNYMQENMELQEGEMSKALVALNQEAAAIPMPKLKNVSRLRTEHWVYELPDMHPLLDGWDMREPDDPGKYLLAIWTPGETANSIQPPESKCSSQECGRLCNEKECFSCNSFREANSQIVRGTILIPCRTAMRGSFPLNGTYFQVNEVFADHDSSLNPISVPRSLIWNLNRRTVYFGTSVSSIFKGLSTQEIQQCFWRGYVCVRGFDRKSRAPRPLMARLHFPASKLAKTKEKTKKESSSVKTQGLKPNTEYPELISNGSNLRETGRA